MSVPPTVTKIKKDGVEFVSSVDRCSYTMKELCRAALRDVGKFICKRFRQAYYTHFKRKKGNVGRFTQYWVKHKYEKYPSLEVGLKPNVFYGGFQEFGSSNQAKLGLLSSTVYDNIDEVIKIESQYLSALEDEAEALALISDSEYEGNGEE